jgi:hydrogenase expression/formation protein HypE
MGKLPPEDLKKLLSCIKMDPKVIVPPQSGFDSGVHRLDGDKYLVVSTDPCIGVPEEWFGWFLIHYVASDIALFGAKMEFCTVNLFGPLTTKLLAFHKIMGQACNVANELEAIIVTGHTGTYEGISKLLGVCTGYGTVYKDKLITPGDAKPGDYVVCIKPIGMEIAVNLALIQEELAERLFGVQRTRELRSLVPQMSCVKEASLLAEIEEVHAMHDAAEGGLIAALNEMAGASNVGFKVEWEKLLFPEEVHVLREFFGLSDKQVLSMSSTGTVLAAVSPEARGKVERALRQNNVEASFLGFFTEDRRCVLVKNDEEMLFPRRADDPYARILSGKL